MVVRRRALLVVGTLAAPAVAVAFVACVGDSPETASAERVDARADDVTSSSDAALDGVVLADAAGDADADGGVSAACDPMKPFGPAVLVQNINSTATEYSARLSADELDIYIETDRNLTGNRDVWVAHRSSKADEFGIPTPIPTLVTAADEEFPTPSADGLTMLLTIDNASIQRSTRPAGGQFGAPAPVASLASDASTTNRTPYLVANGALYFASDRATPSYVVLFRAPPDGFGGFSAPVQVVGLDTPSGVDEETPAVTPDEQTLYFSRRVGNKYDIYVSRRQGSGPFSPGAKVAELSDPTAHTYPTWVSADACTLYFASNRAGGYADAGSTDIYLAKRPK